MITTSASKDIWLKNLRFGQRLISFVNFSHIFFPTIFKQVVKGNFDRNFCVNIVNLEPIGKHCIRWRQMLDPQI